MCINFILNGLSDELYDYYLHCKTSKEISDALQEKYDTKEVGIKNYTVNYYMKFQTTNDKLIVVQSHDLQTIAHKIIFERMLLYE